MLAVLSGTLTLEVADQSYTIRAGGAVLFDGHHDHVYRNAHRRPLDAVLVVIQPTTGDPVATPSHPG
jgi:mannose-6-phosphate isomerase-like protein (cupin superfamily)